MRSRFLSLLHDEWPLATSVVTAALLLAFGGRVAYLMLIFER